MYRMPVMDRMECLVAVLLCVLVTQATAVVNSTLGYNYHYLEDGPCDGSRHIDLGQDGLSLYGFLRPRVDGGYSADIDCSLRVNAPPNHRLIVRFRRIEIYKPFSECQDQDIMYIHGNSSSMSFCGFGTPSYAIMSTSNYLRFQLKTKPRDTVDDFLGFELYYTAFHQGTCQNNDEGHEFRCRTDGRCIPRELKCDKFDNCGDWSDEGVSACGLSSGAILAITVVCVLVGGTCFGFCGYYAYSKHKEKVARRRRNNEISPTMRAEFTTSNGGQTSINISQTCNNSISPTANNNNHSSPYSDPPPPYTYTMAGLYAATEDDKLERDPDAPPAYDNPALQASDTDTTATAGATAGATAAGATAEGANAADATTGATVGATAGAMGEDIVEPTEDTGGATPGPIGATGGTTSDTTVTNTGDTQQSQQTESVHEQSPQKDRSSPKPTD